nr:MAG TPA: hypothetical protein [Caudoviricetes sp.]
MCSQYPYRLIYNKRRIFTLRVFCLILSLFFFKTTLSLSFLKLSSFRYIYLYLKFLTRIIIV